MKKITTILSAAFLTLSFGLSSCMNDFDTPNLDNAYGNNEIEKTATTSISELKAKYANVIKDNSMAEIKGETRIAGVIVGDDSSGNIYKQLFVRDASGVMPISINDGGRYATTPVGQKVVINCEGLFIGGRGEQGQIGYKYDGSVGRMDPYIWEDHVRILDKPNLEYPELTPITFTAADLKNYNKDDAPFLVTFNNVTIKEADGEKSYAPEADKDPGGGVNRTLVLEDGTEIFIRTSIYANFSNSVMPQGKISVTGILSRYRSDWQMVARTEKDILKIEE